MIPADRFFVWQRTKRGKQPFDLRRADGGPFAFAGMWEAWRSHAGAAPLFTCALLPVPANEVVKPVHDRMPAILRPEDYAVWVDRGRADPAKALALAAGYPFPAETMEAVPVGPYVNDPKHDDPGCLAQAT